MNAKQARQQSQIGIQSIYNAPPSAIPRVTASTLGLTASQTLAIQQSLGNITMQPSLTTVNLANLNTIGISSLMSIDTHHAVKKYEVYESPEDLLALSVTMQRLKIEHNNMLTVYKLLERSVIDSVKQSDRDKAKDIRDYYSKKIMFWKLKDINLSKYREDLNTFVHSDGLMFKEEMIGLAYHLPAFYNYDQDIDYIRSCVDINQQFKKLDEESKPRHLRIVAELQPIKRIEKKRKRLDTVQYWFKDTVLNAGCLVSLVSKNPLQPVWDHIFDTEKVLKIDGLYRRVTLDDFEYFSINDWKLDQT